MAASASPASSYCQAANNIARQHARCIYAARCFFSQASPGCQSEQLLRPPSPNRSSEATTQKEIQKARRKTMPIHISPSLTRDSEQTRIRDESPLIYHLPAQLKPIYRLRTMVGLQHYRESLAPPYRVLFDRYQFQDIALKVMGRPLPLSARPAPVGLADPPRRF